MNVEPYLAYLYARAQVKPKRVISTGLKSNMETFIKMLVKQYKDQVNDTDSSDTSANVTVATAPDPDAAGDAIAKTVPMGDTVVAAVPVGNATVATAPDPDAAGDAIAKTVPMGDTVVAAVPVGNVTVATAPGGDAKDPILLSDSAPPPPLRRVRDADMIRPPRENAIKTVWGELSKIDVETADSKLLFASTTRSLLEEMYDDIAKQSAETLMDPYLASKVNDLLSLVAVKCLEQTEGWEILLGSLVYLSQKVGMSLISSGNALKGNFVDYARDTPPKDIDILGYLIGRVDEYRNYTPDQMHQVKRLLPLTAGMNSGIADGTPPEQLSQEGYLTGVMDKDNNPSHVKAGQLLLFGIDNWDGPLEPESPGNSLLRNSYGKHGLTLPEPVNMEGADLFLYYHNEQDDAFAGTTYDAYFGLKGAYTNLMYDDDQPTHIWATCKAILEVCAIVGLNIDNSLEKRDSDTNLDYRFSMFKPEDRKIHIHARKAEGESSADFDEYYQKTLDNWLAQFDEDTRDYDPFKTAKEVLKSADEYKHFINTSEQRRRALILLDLCPYYDQLILQPALEEQDKIADIAKIALQYSLDNYTNPKVAFTQFKSLNGLSYTGLSERRLERFERLGNVCPFELWAAIIAPVQPTCVWKSRNAESSNPPILKEEFFDGGKWKEEEKRRLRHLWDVLFYGYIDTGAGYAIKRPLYKRPGLAHGLITYLDGIVKLALGNYPPGPKLFQREIQAHESFMENVKRLNLKTSGLASGVVNELLTVPDEMAQKAVRYILKVNQDTQ